jgi:lysozyme
MMRMLPALSVLLSFFGGITAAQSQDDEDYSRAELFSITRFQDTGAVDYSLPPRFSFPDNARDSSTFGIDVSHHVYDNCKCAIEWSAIAQKKINFVYLKATQGLTFLDPTVKDDIKALHVLGTLDAGVFHFMTSTDDAGKQADFFVHNLRSFGKLQLIPSLDLEWHLGPITDACPGDAIVKIKRSNGTVVEKCDLWYTLTGGEIISRTNIVLDAIKNENGAEPLLYTNAQWFKTRVGNGARIKDLHTKLIWITDYSKDGLGTERPQVPNGAPWVLWQFTEAARVKSGSNTLQIDASIFEGDLASLRNRIRSH